MAFPTLSKGPRSVTRTPIDNVIKVQSEAGAPISARKRYSKDLWRLDVEYPPMPSADYDLLLHPTTGFWSTVGLYNTFSWTFDGTTYTVRFVTPISVTQSHELGDLVQISFSLESV